MNYDTTSTEVQQVREESLLIQEAEEPCNLAPLNEAELQGVVGGVDGGGIFNLEGDDTIDAA